MAQILALGVDKPHYRGKTPLVIDKTQNQVFADSIDSQVAQRLSCIHLFHCCFSEISRKKHLSLFIVAEVTIDI